MDAQNPQPSKKHILIAGIAIFSIFSISVFFLSRKSTSLTPSSETAPSLLTETNPSPAQLDSQSGRTLASLPAHPSAENAEKTKAQADTNSVTAIKSLPNAGSGSGEQPIQKSPGCFKVSFHLDADKDDELTLRKKSLIKIPREDFNPNSICIRTGKDPVRFEAVKGSKTDFLVGPFAESEKTVTVSYCLGAEKCKDTCKIPQQAKKDSFMAAIGAFEGDEEDPDSGKWNKSGATADAQNKKLNETLDPALRREIARLDAPKRKKGEKDFFDGWVADKEVPACL